MARLRSAVGLLALVACALLMPAPSHAVSQEDIDDCDEFVVEEILNLVPGNEEYVVLQDWEQKLQQKFYLRDELVLIYDVESVCKNPEKNLKMIEAFSELKYDFRGSNRTDPLIRLYRPGVSRLELTNKVRKKFVQIMSFFGAQVGNDDELPMILYMNQDESSNWASQLMTMPSNVVSEVYNGEPSTDALLTFIQLRQRDNHFRHQVNMLQHPFEKKECKSNQLLLVDLAPEDGIGTMALKFASALAEGWYLNRTVVPIQHMEMAYHNNTRNIIRTYHEKNHVYLRRDEHVAPDKLDEDEVQPFPDDLFRSASTCTLRDVSDTELTNLVHYGYVDENRVIWSQEVYANAALYVCPPAYRKYVGEDCDRWWASRLLLYALHPNMIGVSWIAQKLQMYHNQGVIDMFGHKEMLSIHARGGNDYKYKIYDWETEIVEAVKTYKEKHPDVVIENAFLATDNQTIVKNYTTLEYMKNTTGIKPYATFHQLRFGYDEEAINNCTTFLGLCLRNDNMVLDWHLKEYPAPGVAIGESLMDMMAIAATTHFIGSGASRFGVVGYILRHFKFFPGQEMPGPMLLDEEGIASGNIPWGGIPMMRNMFEMVTDAVDGDLWDRFSAALFALPVSAMPIPDGDIPAEYKIKFDVDTGIPIIPHEPFYDIIGKRVGTYRIPQAQKVQRIKFRFNPTTMGPPCPVKLKKDDEGNDIPATGAQYFTTGYQLVKMGHFPLALHCMSMAVVTRTGLEKESLDAAASLTQKIRIKTAGWLLNKVKTKGDITFAHSAKSREEDSENQKGGVHWETHNMVDCPMSGMNLYTDTQDVVDVAYALFDEGQYEYTMACFAHLLYLMESGSRPRHPHEYEMLSQNFHALDALHTAPGGLEGKLKYVHNTGGTTPAAYDLGTYNRDEYIFVKEAEVNLHACQYMLELFETDFQYLSKKVVPSYKSAVTDVVMTQLRIDGHEDARWSAGEWEAVKRLMNSLNSFEREVQPISRYPSPLGDTGLYIYRIDEGSDPTLWEDPLAENKTGMFGFFCVLGENGGEVEFPDVGTVLEPKTGDCVIYPSLFKAIHHAAKKGPKYILQTWIRTDVEDLEDYDHHEVEKFLTTGIWQPKTKEELLHIFRDEL